MSNSIAEAVQAEIVNTTLSASIEFKKRLPEEGLKWGVTRAAGKRLQGGRLDVHITLMDEGMDLVALSRQTVLVTDAKKRFQPRVKEVKL